MYERKQLVRFGSITCDHTILASFAINMCVCLWVCDVLVENSNFSRFFVLCVNNNDDVRLFYKRLEWQ